MLNMESKPRLSPNSCKKKTKHSNKNSRACRSSWRKKDAACKMPRSAKIRDTEVRSTTLRQELDEKQGRRADVTDKNSKLAEKSAHLEQRLNEMATAVQQGEDRVRAVEGEKQ